MELQNLETLRSLLLITILAVAVPMVSVRLQRFRIPVVVGEILVGIVIGHSGLNLIETNPILEFLAWFGFIFLMFLSGLELDFDLLVLPKEKSKRLLKQPVPLAIAVFLVTLGLGLTVGFLLQESGLVTNAVLMGLILSTTSLGVVVPVLKERHLVTSRYGQVILISALLADFVTLLLFSLDVALLSKGLTLDLLLVLVLLVLFAAAVRMSRFLSNLPGLHRIKQELGHATAQIEVRGSFALMVGWAALAAVLGAEVILGAFLAGAIVSLMTDRHDSVLREKLDAIGFGFFIPIFFIMVGVNFNASALLASREGLLLVPVLLVAAYAIKLGASLFFRASFDWRHTLAGGLLLSSRLSLIIAASAIALDLGVIDDAVNSAIILVAIVTVTLSPILFDIILPKKAAPATRSGIIVVGSRQLAVLLAQRLAKAAAVTMVSRREIQLSPNQSKSIGRIPGDARDADVLARAGAETAEALVTLSIDHDFNENVAQVASERFGIDRIVTWAEEGDDLNLLETMGVRTIRPQLATVLSLEGATRFPASFDLLTHQDADMDVGEGQLCNPALHRRAVRDLHLPGDVLVVGIRRNGERIVPHGETILHRGDIVLMVGSPNCLREALAWLEEEGFEG
ncbi:MAG: hypothetical protein GY764_09365 [Halieaceae bacterium]|nr:hypothetical protein [Halieaceae bacterium]